jgi:hypothetical protein
VRVPYYPGDAFQSGYLVRGALRITASDDNARSRIGAMNLAYSFACLRIGSSRHRTRIQHYEVSGRLVVSKKQSAGKQAMTKRGGIRLGCATSEIFDGKCGHAIASVLSGRNAEPDYSSVYGRTEFRLEKTNEGRAMF